MVSRSPDPTRNQATPNTSIRKPQVWTYATRRTYSRAAWRGSTRRPSHLPSSDYVEVKVKYALSGPFAVVDDQPIATLFEVELFGNGPSRQQQRPKEFRVLGL